MRKSLALCVAFAGAILLSQATHAKTQFFVQLGTVESEILAQQSWQELQDKYPAMLENLNLRTTQAFGMNGSGDDFRIQGGPLTSRLKAEKVCAKLANHADGCFIVESAVLMPLPNRSEPLLALPDVPSFSFGEDNQQLTSSTSTSAPKDPIITTDQKTDTALTPVETEALDDVELAQATDRREAVTLPWLTQRRRPLLEQNIHDTSIFVQEATAPQVEVASSQPTATDAKAITASDDTSLPWGSSEEAGKRIEVGEAVRIPVTNRGLSSGVSSPSIQLPDTSAPKLEAVESEERTPDQMWINVGHFADTGSAEVFLNTLQPRLTLIDPLLRSRVLRNRSISDQPVTTISVGPVWNKDIAGQVCSTASQISSGSVQCGSSAVLAARAPEQPISPTPTQVTPLITAQPSNNTKSIDADLPWGKAPSPTRERIMVRPAEPPVTTSPPIIVTRAERYENMRRQAGLSQFNYTPPAQRVSAQSRQFWVQLGTAKTQADAVQLWESLASNHEAVLSDYQPSYSLPQRVSIGADPRIRLRIGPYAVRERADTVCLRLTQENANCLVLSE